MIDWFTVVAQLINFLILIALLRHFLYGRIIAAIDQRESEIVTRRKEADDDRAEARLELAQAQKRNQELDAQREKLLAEVQDEIDDYRQAQMATIRENIETTQARWSKSIHEEQGAFLQELRVRVADSVTLIARQAFADLADASLESRMVARFLHEIKTLDDSDRDKLIASLARAKQQTVIQTTHEIPDDLQATLLTDLEETLGVKLNAHFEVTNDLQCGIAMQTNSHKLAWNLRDYLSAMEDDFRTLFAEQAVVRRDVDKLAEA